MPTAGAGPTGIFLAAVLHRLESGPAFQFPAHSHSACIAPARRDGGELAGRRRNLPVKIALPADYRVIGSHAATVPTAGADRQEGTRWWGNRLIVTGPPAYHQIVGRHATAVRPAALTDRKVPDGGVACPVCSAKSPVDTRFSPQQTRVSSALMPQAWDPPVLMGLEHPGRRLGSSVRANRTKAHSIRYAPDTPAGCRTVGFYSAGITVAGAYGSKSGFRRFSLTFATISPTQHCPV